MDRIDLHTHTTASDGTFSPNEIVEYAKQKGLKAIAVTDHDTIDGLDEVIKAGSIYNVEIVSGVEFAADYNGTEIHVLGYYIDYEDLNLQNKIKDIKLNRELRNINMIENLKKLGFDVTVEELYNISGSKDIVTRAHFAKLLLKKGYIQTIDEAFKKYISEGCPAYIPRNLMNSQQCIDLILKSKGIATLAHPTLYKMDMDEIDIMVKQLKGYGLQAVEAMYSLYSKEQEMDIKAIAQKYDLKITGGTDFHGKNKPNIDLGSGIDNNLCIPYEILENLRN